MKLYLIRHGETVENSRRITQGQLPGHLSASGKSQAKALGLKMKKVKLSAIYSSDLARARDTAKEIARHHPDLEVQHRVEIRERHWGIYQGIKGGGPLFKSLPGGLVRRRPKGGESMIEVRRRVKSFLNYLQRQHGQDHQIAIVSHGGVIRMFLSLIHEKPISKVLEMRIANTEVFELEID